jgi:hypothetical protein
VPLYAPRIDITLSATAVLDAEGLQRVLLSRARLPDIDLTDHLFQHEFKAAEAQILLDEFVTNTRNAL